MFAKSVDRPFCGVYIFPRPESVAHKPAAFQLEFKLAASFGFFSPLSLEFSFGAMHKAQVVCAWVTLGGGWSKFQVQSQQTATVLRWRNLPPPVLWVYIFDWSHNFPHSNQMFQALTVYYLSLFSITSSIKMRNNIQKMGNTSAKSSCPFSSKGTLTVVRKHLSHFRSYCLTQFFLLLLPCCNPFPVPGQSWSLLTPKAYKNSRANSSGPPKECQTSKGDAVFCQFCV